MYVYFCVIVGCRSKLRLQQQWSISVPTIHRWLVQQVWRNSTFFDSSHTWNVSSQLFINRAIYSLDILWNVFIYFCSAICRQFTVSCDMTLPLFYAWLSLGTKLSFKDWRELTLQVHTQCIRYSGQLSAWQNFRFPISHLPSHVKLVPPLALRSTAGQVKIN